MDRNEKFAALPAPLLAWYDQNKRDLPWRENTDPYRVWVSEIMLQQTRVEAARDYYIRFLRELPTVEALAACPEEKLLKLWEGLGYYSRAKNMQKAAKEIVARGGFPERAEGLRKLPGVGEYTAGAISSIAFGNPAPAVDGNVVRVLSRIMGDGEAQDILRKRYFAELAPIYPAGRCGDFTQSLMELGALLCLPASPRCLLCPVYALCATKSDALPAKRDKPARKETEMTVFLFRGDNGLWLGKRGSGVLAGMTEFYNREQKMSAAEAHTFLQGAGLQHFCLQRAGAHKHIFTHLVWHMTAYTVDTQQDLSSLPAFAELKFYTKKEAEESVSLPSAFRWCMQWIK